MVQNLSEEEQLALLAKVTQLIETGEAKQTEVEEGHVTGVNELRFLLPVGDKKSHLVAAIPRELGSESGLILRGQDGRVVLRVKRNGMEITTSPFAPLPSAMGSFKPDPATAARANACALLLEAAEQVAEPVERLREARQAELDQQEADEQALLAREAADMVLGLGLPSVSEFYFGNIAIPELSADEASRLLQEVAKDFLVQDELEKLRRAMVQFAANKPNEIGRLEPVLEILKERLERNDLSRSTRGLAGIPFQTLGTAQAVYDEIQAGLGLQAKGGREL
jgi:hypothetical protein